MAKIVLAIGMTAAGAALGLAFGPAGLGMMGLLGLEEGAAMGASLGLAVGGILFRPKIPGMMPLQDRQVSSSADGAPIPFGYGRGRFAGQMIWSPGIKYYTVGSATASLKGAGSNAGQQYVYTASFAVAFGEGPATIEQIWADSKLIYMGGNAFGTFAPWSADVQYQPEQLVSYQWQPVPNEDFITAIYQCSIANQGILPAGDSLHWTLTGYTFYDSTVQYYPGNQVAYPPNKGSLYAPTSGQIYTCVNPCLGVTPEPASDWNTMTEYYGTPTLYPGTGTQMPDPTIQGNNGVDATPAFRGLAYAVFEDFPLANFGNRVPNLRAQVNFSGVPDAVTTVLPTSPTIVQRGFARYTLAIGGPPGAMPVMLPLPPIPGNTLVFLFSGYRGPTIPAGLTYLDGILAAGSDYQGATVWTRTVQDGDSNIWTFENSGEGGPWNLAVYELSAGASIVGLALDAGGSDGTYITGAPLNPGAGAVTIVGILGWEESSDIASLLPSYFDIENRFDLGFQAYYGAAITAQGASLPSSVLSWTLESGTGSAGVGAFLIATAPNVALTIDSGAPALAGIVQDLCVRAGLEADQVDVSQLTATQVFPTNQVPGYILERQTNGVGALKELMVAYFFGGCESDGVLKFVPRTYLTLDGGSPESVFTIAEDDLGLLADKAKLEEDFGQEQDLPLMVTALYNDIALNWQQGKQLKQRNARTVNTTQQQVLSMPLSLSDTNARQIAEATLYSAWQARTTYALNLWRALYAMLDPTDIINMVYQGATYEIRIVKNTIGQGLAVALKCVSEDVRNYGSVVAGVANQAFQPSTLVTSAPTLLWLFDLPLLRDSDSNPSGSGFYAAISSIAAGWPGGVLFQSSDNAEFTQIDSEDVPASFGSALNALPPPASPWVWDTVNSLYINLVTGALAGASDLSILNGANVLIVGGEVIQFADAVQNEDGSWTVSRLLRGRRGTEAACTGHAVGEVVIQLLTGGVLREAAPLSQIGQLRYYQGITEGQPVGSSQDVNLTLAGNDLKPYSVVAISGTQDSSGDWVMAWIRRTRIGGAWMDGTGTVPLSEVSEAYQIDILNGSTVVRTIDASSPYAVYLAAQQVADFGSAQATLRVNIYQMSAQAGRGFPAAATLPAASAAAVAAPGGGSFYVN
jgi:hypothetical protein